MKLEDKNGISLIALIITIIVMIIIAAIAVFNLRDVLSMTNDTKYGVERSELAKAVSARFTNYCKNSIAYPLLGTPVDASELAEDEVAYVDYIRILDYSDIVQLGVENVDSDSVYKVNYYTNDVTLLEE